MFRMLESGFYSCINGERSLAIFAAGSLVVLSLTGCSVQPAVYPVRGHVTMSDGSPVNFGLLEFRNTSMKLNARARIQNDGSYQLTTFEESDGAVVGTHQAIILQHVVAEMARPRKEIPGQERAVEQHRQHRIVDSQFARYQTSPLVFEVEAKEENVINITVF